MMKAMRPFLPGKVALAGVAKVSTTAVTNSTVSNTYMFFLFIVFSSSFLVSLCRDYLLGCSRPGCDTNLSAATGVDASVHRSGSQHSRRAIRLGDCLERPPPAS